MAKKFVYQKSASGVSDFVYVDLLPQVKRASQFNMNVIIAGTLAVVATYFFIFIPYRQQTELFEEKNGMLNDLSHRVTLKQEEQILHEIDLDVIEFEDEKNELEGLSVNFNLLLLDIKEEIQENTGDLKEVFYSAETELLQVKVTHKQELSDSTFQEAFLNIDWVLDVTRENKNFSGDLWEFTYILEVDAQNVE